MQSLKNKLASSYLHTLHHLLEHTPLTDLLPYRLFDHSNNIFINTKSMGALWEITPFIGCDPSMFKSLHSIFQYIAPVGSSIQCTLIASPHIGAALQQWTDQRTPGLMQTIAHKRTLYMMHEHAYALRNFTATLSLSLPKKYLTSQSHIKSFVRVCQQITSILKNLGSHLTIGTPQTLIRTVQNLTFFSNIAPLHTTWNQKVSLHEQCLPKGYRLTVHENALHGHYQDTTTQASLFTATTFPAQWSLDAMHQLIGSDNNNLLQINTPFFLSYGVHIPDERTLKSRILTKCAQVEKQAFSPLARWIPSLRKEAAEWHHVRTQCEKGERLVRTRFQVGLWGKKEEMLTHETTLSMLFRNHGFTLEKDRFTMLPALISCLPFTWGEGIANDALRFHSLKTTLASEPPLLMPLQGDWKGTASPGLLLSSRKGQLCFWCPFDNTMGNYNVCVVGRSGSGKSVFMQEIALTNLSRQGHVFVIDVGRSFEKMGHLLDAHYISFSEKNTISLNPFSSLHQGLGDMLSLVKPILCSMASPTNALQDIERSLMDKAIHETWKQLYDNTTVTDIASTLKSYQSSISCNLADKLFPYTLDGPYGKFFHGKSTPFGHKPFVIIEMEELKERKDLQAVLVQMIIHNITTNLYCGDRSTKTHIILDEAWDLLRGGSAALFIETAARRMRKYQGSLIVGTQSPHDFFQNPSALAAFENSDWTCFLSQKRDAVCSLKQSGKIALTPHLENSLTSLHTVQGDYAEVLIYGPQGYAINRLNLDPFSRMIFTTKPSEFVFIRSLLDQGISLIEALQKAADHFQ